MIFNGVRKNYITVLRKKRPYWAPRNRILLKIPNRPGALVKKTEIDIRIIPLRVLLEGDSEADLQTKAEDFVEWLNHDEAKELILDDEPDRAYYAMVDGALDPEELVTVGFVDINFICPDSYKYGLEKTYDFTNGSAIINNQGTAQAAPIYEIDVLEDISHLDIFTDEAYMRIGEPAPIDQPPYERQTLILNNPLSSLTGWTGASEFDNGYVTGSMAATPSGFEVSNFGSIVTPHRWQGPAVRRSLPEAIQNIRMDLEVELLNVGKQTGMIEVYLKDAQGNTVAKVGIEDIWFSITKIQAKFQLGNVNEREVQYYRTADYPAAWNNFKGMLRVYRDGNRFRPYFGLIQPDGKHVWVSQAYMYTDAAGDYSAPIVEIVLAIRKWPGTTEANMKMRNLKVWRLNDQPQGIPIIASAGDKIVIDTNDSSIRINGEDRKDLKDFGASFFKLPKDQTALLLQPADKVSGKVTFRERFL